MPFQAPNTQTVADSGPFRATLLTAERLRVRARELAEQLTWSTTPATRDTPLRQMVDDAGAEMGSHNSLLAEAVRLQHPISPASEWLLDNYYLIEEQVQTVRSDLPSGYGRELPRVLEGPFAGLPRVYACAVTLIAHTDARIDEEYLLEFSDGFQDSSPWSIGEVWAVPIMLRVALVENARRLARSVAEAHVAGRRADVWADRLLLAAPEQTESLRELIDALESEVAKASPVFLMRLSQRLSGQDIGVEPIGAWLERRLSALGITLDQLAHDLQQAQAADQISIANTITSIRFLDAYEWRTFFETACVVEQILRQDPSGVYPRMDFKSRDRYRHALESLARRTPLDEITVAEAVISHCVQALITDPSDQVAGHVGHYLISASRFKFERSVRYRPHFREVLYRGPLANKGLFYWGVLAVLTVALLGMLATWLLLEGSGTRALAIVALLALIPLSDLALSMTNRLSAWVFPPRVLPKLDYLQPLSESHRTLVIVPALITSVPAVRKVLDNLEVAYLANRDDNVGFGLLGDLRASEHQRVVGDAAIIEAAIEGIASLNERYEVEHGRRPFALFIRERRFNEAENSWMGWERKRGSLMELNHWLRASSDTSFAHVTGDEEFLRAVTFVLTLDADTVLPRDGARKLVSTIAHPLNRARVAPGDERVLGGYGLVQPRVSMSLPASSRSFFAWLYSGPTGIDPYAGAVSDTYQDVFGEGSFTGKGIYEVSLFNTLLDGRFPENTLLSHDLIEGSFLRVALASDVEVFDDHPASYLAHMARLHRWVRGDWQTLPWLTPRVRGEHGLTPNPLSRLHRWKILDNLRRSLVAPSSLALITLGWFLLPGPLWVWPLAFGLVVFFPAYFALADAIVARPATIPFATVAAAAWREFGRDSARALLTLALIPHQAQVMTDAICRALWRMAVSHRGLLEWETAADAEKRLKDDLAGFTRRLAPSSAVAIALLIPGCVTHLERIAPSLLLAAVWASAPYIAWRISQVRVTEPEPLDGHARRDLRRTARRTWRFFETFVTPYGHHLAPDNFQEDPNGEVAWRTSPTNIGLQLLSALTAFDLGYVTLRELISRTADTLNTMVGLERFGGHYYNWYDCRTLEPLPPKYISTVDSGNLAGHLLVLRMGLLEASEGPLLDKQLLEGLVDTISLAIEDLFVDRDRLSPDETVRLLRESLDELERDVALDEELVDLGAWSALLARLETLVKAATASACELEDGDPDATTGTPHPASPLARVRASIHAIEERVSKARVLLEDLAPWAESLTRVPVAVASDPRWPQLAPILDYVPSLVGLAEGLEVVLQVLDSFADDPPGSSAEERQEAARWASEVANGIRAARPDCQELLGRLRLDAAIARQMWEHTDFRLLFDARRLLFSIGFNTAEGRLDPSYYDMLASECRLASFLAIAKGDVPQEHWFRLGRAVTGTAGGRALLSWSASMFEYLMPMLVMRTWPLTMLDETVRSVVKRQIQYGQERGVPWGVSESAFNAKDAALVYQYQAFGVPGLGLKRGLSDDIVIAPYATVLALPVSASEAYENLRVLAEQGGRGRYGYYEALDYTPGRVPAGARRAVVRAYFAHHQGMSLVAIGNELTGYRMHDRFHGDPMVGSAELLLQERVPSRAQLTQPHVEEVKHVRSVRELPPPVIRAYPLADTPVPSTHFLSNGRYSVMVTNGGGGYSRWQDMAVTRYREDVTRDCWGQFFYLRDVDNDVIWTAAHNPGILKPEDYHVTYSADKAEYRRVDGDIETHVEVSVSPEDDVEVRRLTLANRSREPRRIEVTSYFEISLADQAADQMHKSFSNLFVETEAIEHLHAIVFSRRPRSAEEPRPFGLHVMACEAEEKCEWSYETDRARFIGRLNGTDAPAAVVAGGPLSRTTGAVLDPACAIRQGVTIPAGSSVRLVFVTGVADTREAALRLAETYHDVRSAQRAIDLAWTTAQIELRDLGITPQEAVTLQRLASRLLLTDPHSVLKVKTPTENGLPLSGLWSIGVSGDYPILLVRIEDLEHTPLVRQALLAHQYWRHKGLVADLVVLNTRPTSYADELDERLRLLVRTGHALQLVDKPGGVYLRRADQMHPDVMNLLLSVARATLEGDGGALEVQLNRRATRPVEPPRLVPSRPAQDDPQPPFARPELLYDNSYGGFDPETGDYVMVLDESTVTPAPWINVMASPRFGTMVSEAGIACTWAENSHENRITTWNNDPVSDGSGEVIYLRDEETGQFWSPTPLPVRGTAPYMVRHSKGSSRFEHTSHGIASTLDLFVPVEDPVRVARLKLENLTDRTRRLSVTQFVEWVLGNSRSKAQHLVVTWYDAERETLTAHNHHNPDFPGRAAFLACDRPLHSFTGSRTEFVGRNRRPSDPAAMHRRELGRHTGRYHDNCGALMTQLELEPGASVVVTFLLGQTPTLDESRDLVAKYRMPGEVDAALEEARGMWRDLLGTVQAKTPDPALDLLVNERLLYQALACRLWGRTATYQSSGAYGFRDQLQDVLALMVARPDLVREQIVEASRHQFPEGDVLHWWQPVSGRGVRTRITDDRHWLPYVVAEYVEATGDTSVLHERTAFIEGPPLEEGREDNYMQPTTSEQAATVYEHCVAALEAGAGTGPHGLPLMGGGDWNDGMNRVGIDGTGESVWLGWFLDVVLRRFAPLCELMDEPERASEYRERAKRFIQAVESEGWDGSWYRRAYFDDGTPLGTRHAEECRIDAIAQAWATISGSGDPNRAQRALDAVEEKLIKRETGIVALLAPPFDKMEHDPGYIKGYVPGVRENGGQYTHAAVWVVLAYLLQGDGDEAHGLLDLINPVKHALTREAADVYKVEPYVVAADVYAAEPHVGRGGWTWYTGSASWFYQVVIRHHLGLWVVVKDEKRHLRVDPCIPRSWKSYELEYRDQGTLYRITVENPRGVNRGVERVALDGEDLPGLLVPLARDGAEHEVRVTLLGG